MHRVVFGEHKPGLPPELDGVTVDVLGWVERLYGAPYARVKTAEGLVYNVIEPCLVPTEEVVLVAHQAAPGALAALDRWALTGTETVDELTIALQKSELTDLLEDLYPLPDELKIKRKDNKAELAEKVLKAIALKAG